MSKQPIMLRTGKTPDMTQCIEHSLTSYNLSTHGPQLSVLLETINGASVAFIAGQYHQALQKYKTSLNIISEIECCKEYETVIQYMLCIIWLESTLLEDLLEALKCLCKLESSIGDNFPSVYYALGKTHMKLYRFEAAQETINKGFAFLNKEIEFHCRYIPGTDIIIKESTRQGLSDALMKLSDECSGWHPPDAVCSLKECQNFSDFYPQPNRNIFYSDPAFNGMVVITCSNNAFPCVMKFHQVCWKYQKEQMSSVKKFSDKEVIGQKCFTPNCESANIPNTIMRVEVYGEDAQLKATIEGSNQIAWPTKIAPIKGAIKKQLPSTPVHKLRRPNLPIPAQQKEVNGIRDQKEKIDDVLELVWRVAKLEDLREINFGITPETNWVPDQTLYGNEHMIETIHFLDFDATNTPCAEMKVFIFEMFYEYIKNNGPLLIEDVLRKWQETQTIIDNAQHILSGFTDITEFLLQSPKIVRMEDLICTAYDLSKAHNLLGDNTLRKFCFLTSYSNQQQEIEFNSNDTETIPNQVFCNDNKENLPKLYNSNETQISEMPEKTLPKNINSTNLETLKNVESTNCDILHERDTQDINKVTKSIRDKTESPIINPEIDNCFEPIENDYYGLNQLFSKIFSPEIMYTSDDLNVNRSETKNFISINKNNPFLDNYQEDSMSINSNNDRSHVARNITKLTPSADHSKLFNDFLTMNNIKKDDLKDDSVLRKAENLKQDDEDTENLSEEDSVLQTHFKEEGKVLQEESIVETQSLPEGVNALIKEINVLIEEKIEYKNIIKVMQKELEDYKDKVSELSKNLCDSEEKNFKTKQKLLKDCLHHQFISNKHFIMGKMDVCNAILEAFDNFILIIEKLSGYRLPPFNAEWLQMIYKYHTLFIEHQTEYIQRNKMLDSAEEIEKMDEITLKLTDIPAFPRKSITDQVGELFQKYQQHFSQPMMQYPHVAAMAGNPLFMRPPLFMNRPPFPPSPYQNNIPGLHPNGMPHKNSGQVIFPPPMMQNPNFQAPAAKVDNVIPQQQQQQQQAINDTTKNVKTDQGEKADVLTKSTENVKVPEKDSAVLTNTDTKVQSKGNTETASLPIKNLEKEVSQDDHENSGLPEIEKQNVLTSNTKVDDKLKSNLVSTVSKSEDNLVKSTEDSTDIKKDTLRTEMSNKQKLNLLVMELKEEIMGIMELDVIESIESVKRKNNGTLNGLTYNKIYNEAKKHIISRQQKYLDMYTTSEEGHSQQTQTATTSGNAPSMSSEKRFLNTDVSLHYQPLTRTINDRQKQRAKSVSLDRSGQKDTRALSSTKPVWNPITNPNEGWQKEYQESECVICMFSINDNHKLTYTLTCKHTFHKVCVKDWFKQSQSCPICRVHCTIDDEFPPLPL